jgi:Metallo-beta-lactamase superfamily
VVSLLLNDNQLDAPAADTVEIVVFGPGIGESIAIHLGSNEWIIIDSCIFPGEDIPTPILYLRHIGVDASSAVKRVLATHWHDDHIRGLGAVLSECQQARFAMSGALAVDQFFQLVLEVDESNKLVSGSSSASEFASILEELERRGRKILAPDFYAQSAMVLYRGGYQKSAVVHALSPSAATITSANTDLAKRLLTTGQTRRFKQFGPNDLSVAIQVAVGQLNFLLGADLENTANPEFGWQAVIDSPSRPEQSSELFKVAHHGSSNADHPDVWSRLLGDNPVAIVTPFASSSLPRSNDVARIKGKTDSAYCTTWPPSRKPARRQGVDRFIGFATRNRRAVNRSSGFVRVRFDLSSDDALPQVSLFGSAKLL